VSYNSIWASVGDEALRGRITACVAQESDVGDDPFALYLQVQWPVLTATDVEEAYEYALASGTENPGRDETVITDGMILSHVQATLAELEPDEVTPTDRRGA